MSVSAVKNMSKKYNSQFINIENDSYLSFSAHDSNQVPEKRLLFAICERTVRDYLSTNTQEHEEAKEWLFDTGCAPFSFFWICDWLEMDKFILLEQIQHLYLRGRKRERASREIYDLIRERNEDVAA